MVQKGDALRYEKNTTRTEMKNVGNEQIERTNKMLMMTTKQQVSTTT
eukprot:CAMPEP_0170797592 /NCGR_PEP_ID=MMETSP0733-20121128/25709_1 /TAXON_ID=186038 /ORGANISM="Fragilariopsis kerguelensis, Strain L26-C5" /LENGTH=46 /DNA_ID= /DNA_START= /DNA_END= /DNA_ORIENTATION=